MRIQSLAKRLARSARERFVGREAELGALLRLLDGDRTRLVHLHGIAGIGKSSLLQVFAERCARQGARVVQLDCRAIEPTPQRFLARIAEAGGAVEGGLEDVIDALEHLGGSVILALDNFEVFRLMDAWLRQSFVPALPDNVRIVFSGRERPPPAWRALPGSHGLFEFVPLGPLLERDAVALLCGLELPREVAERIAGSAHGHPLALQLAASAQHERSELAFKGATLQQALNELTQMFLEDVRDPVTREVLEGASVVRRANEPLLAALFPHIGAQEAYERLRALPFVDVASDGLAVHEVVRESVARSLHARDPGRHLGYQRAAWRRLAAGAGALPPSELWRTTADMLYLVGNPVVREAFFPHGSTQLTVEPARPEDDAAIRRIVRAHERDPAAERLLGWWRRLPQSFSIVRGRDGGADGMLCKFEAHRVQRQWLQEDPLTLQWVDHLQRSPLERGEIALFCRRWLSTREGEAPSDAQAAAWLDLKRTYMELRPALRRVYLAVRDLSPYAPAAQRLGFAILPAAAGSVDGAEYQSAVLDFGPGSVDGWLARLAAAELGIAHDSALLDIDAREAVLGERRVPLTPLEFGVLQRLVHREGKVVSRTELLREVWGTRYEGGSNVVDAVIRGLRRKLGDKANRIKTVTGVGYRLRSPS